MARIIVFYLFEESKIKIENQVAVQLAAGLLFVL
jgi:hypothetical protein